MKKFEEALKEAFLATFNQSAEALKDLSIKYEKSDKSMPLESFAWWACPKNLGDCDYNLCVRLFSKLMEKKGYRKVTNDDIHRYGSPFSHSDKMKLRRIGRHGISKKWLKAQEMACVGQDWVDHWRKNRKENNRYARSIQKGQHSTRGMYWGDNPIDVNPF